MPALPHEVFLFAGKEQTVKKLLQRLSGISKLYTDFGAFLAVLQR